VILLHSFPFDSRMWASTGVTDAIIAAGRAVITADRRGSGQSARPHDPRAYRANACARDVTGLIDHLGLDHDFVDPADHASTMDHPLFAARLIAHLA
jgi:pimeloyl-ACP methyl ester carboxylesterase